MVVHRHASLGRTHLLGLRHRLLCGRSEQEAVGTLLLLEPVGLLHLLLLDHHFEYVYLPPNREARVVAFGAAGPGLDIGGVAIETLLPKDAMVLLRKFPEGELPVDVTLDPDHMDRQVPDVARADVAKDVVHIALAREASGEDIDDIAIRWRQRHVHAAEEVGLASERLQSVEPLLSSAKLVRRRRHHLPLPKHRTPARSKFHKVELALRHQERVEHALQSRLDVGQ
mmetsp:Transcript_131578/g.281332  ORF Transcript_131578/g.281332 Transcript_131578/m.281332 type:complete len:227 (-) Transcript_131578:908-1588(-)